MATTPVFLPEKTEEELDRGAWRATVHGVAKSWTRLSMHEPFVLIMSTEQFLKKMYLQ